MQKFVMVPVETLKAGDVVQVDPRTPMRYAQPVAEVNLREDGVELVFIEKSAVGDHGIRVAGVYRYQFPIAVIRDPEPQIAETIERWLAEAGSGEFRPDRPTTEGPSTG